VAGVLADLGEEKNFPTQRREETQRKKSGTIIH
jgi:hypothetical protein